ncbi:MULTISPECIES: mycothiol transferase [unclassified Rhodococcus (in: high G+C Gram-positive bacteria)]|uniref:mycothiol transferase n=1 Tax=unclassified Rhodococcus (in: high G+C Gram-positive bacteria) TaxID=192944 RepID=UPI0007BB86D1|nr:MULTISPECIES: DUF664 domain-containing protein [unclassified Rhodococcus (in: high G+C Gram-positive bacteria)]KZF11254.1 Mini-circle protein [Rhodococcus sp. EPR-147]KZF12031.1 Mini-circle protein [Rhodococcus sp. EPR-279]
MAKLTTFPEPSSALSDPAELFREYLAFYRRELVRRITSLSDDALTSTAVPSEWTPLQMLTHLVHMEQRWFVWGFLGRAVGAPWGDAKDGSWHVPADVDAEALLSRLDDGTRLTDEILNSHRMDELATLGGRFSDEQPTLIWICFHVLQEYARHLGHLDVAVELAGGPTGEAEN